MAATFLTRSQAALAARRRGIEAFSCHQYDNGQWGYEEQPSSKTFQSAVKIALTKDYVNHVEMHAGEPIFIVTCLKEELASERLSYRVAPLTPSLWEGHSNEVRRMIGGSENRQMAKPGSSIARTSPKGAVQIVWDTCDENSELPRNEIIKLCVNKGIHPSTAATQYAKWNKNRRS